MKPIAIYGAGGLGREVNMLIMQINESIPTWNVVGFFDDNHSRQTEIHNLKVIGDMNDLNNWHEPLAITLAIGNPISKRAVVEKIQNTNIYFPNLIHPSIRLNSEQNITLGKGCILCEGNILTCDIRVGNHVLINLCSTIGHDTEIGDYCSIMPGCNISGQVKTGEAVYFGTGSKVINGKYIGNNAVIGAGAVIVRDVESGDTMVGIPARPKDNR